MKGEKGEKKNTNKNKVVYSRRDHKLEQIAPSLILSERLSEAENKPFSWAFTTSSFF